MNNIYITLFLISAASLAFQVTLTRFFSLAQGSHLAFMAISLALLGIGASGTYLSLKRLTGPGLRRTIAGGSFLFALTVPAAYLTINYLPFDSYRLAWERLQLLWLVLYYLALTVPFFFSGLVIGAALAAQPEQAGPTYAANLLGSGLGPPLALLALATLGGPGAIFLCALLGWLAAGSSRISHLTSRPLRSPASALRFIYALIALLLLYFMIQPPALFAVRLTPYKALSQALLYPDSDIVFSRWNAFSRVDVLRSEGIRSAPGLSLAYPGDLPPQLGLMVDGGNLTPITNPTEPSLTAYLPLTLGFTLRPAADVLILEPGGGLAVLAALENGARRVTVVHSNPTVVEAVGDRFAAFNDNLYADPRVTVVSEEPRSFLGRTDRRFDLIIWPLTDSFRPVTAGAYTLNEDYRYTVETFSEALAHLSPQGLLVAERWLQLPPSESLRLWGTAIEAVRRASDLGTGNQAPPAGPAAHLLAMRSLQTSVVIVAPSPLSEQDLAAAREFAAERQFDLIWLPDIRPAETNRYSVVPEAVYYQTFSELLTTSEPRAFFAAYPYAVAPPTDNHPYFFHFFKWGQTPEIIQTLGRTWQPFGGSGYLVLVVLLALVVILSAILILLPLLAATGLGRGTAEPGGRKAGEPLWPEASPAGRRERDAAFSEGPAASSKKLVGRYLLYFTLLGFGFLFVEIPLLQRFILYLGQPAYAFAVVVSALLAALGLGSYYLSSRLPLRIALALIVLVTVIYPVLLPYLFEATLRLPFAGRVILTIGALLPPGLLMGVPFPRGLVIVGRTWPALTPWAWAVNGCASVISAVLAAMIALTWGFAAVLWSAAVAYGLAGLVMRE